MSLNKASIVALLAVAGMAVSSVSMAQATQDRGWYAGVSMGQSEIKDGCTGVAPGISCDDKDTAWKIFGGYQLNRNFSAELGYSNLGEAKASAGGVNASVEATAWDLVGVGSFPVTNQFSVYGKLGVYRAETEGRSNVGVSADETNSGLTYGFGVRYDFTRNLGVRAEWQRYGDVGGGSIGESDVDIMSIGVIWKF
jgi:OmpA-OmpF porin, OOP family